MSRIRRAKPRILAKVLGQIEAHGLAHGAPVVEEACAPGHRSVLLALFYRVAGRVKKIGSPGSRLNGP